MSRAINSKKIGNAIRIYFESGKSVDYALSYFDHADIEEVKNDFGGIKNEVCFF